MKKWAGRLALAAVLGFSVLGAGEYAFRETVLETEAAEEFAGIFDASYYAMRYPEVAAVYGYDPAKLYEHYARSGAREGRQPSADFNPHIYRANYADLQQAFGTSWIQYARHYVYIGKTEGRVASALLDKNLSEVQLPFYEAAAEASDSAVKVQKAPDKGAYYTTYNPQETDLAVRGAADLTAGKKVAWDPAKIYPGSPMKMYYDGSILVVGWKEQVGATLVTYMEVFTENGSQIKRKFAGDTYGGGPLQTAEALAARAGAVAASNADFYATRPMGTVVYQGQICRFDATLDSCYFTNDGDMLFSYAGQFRDRESLQAFIDANDIDFSVTFGPIIIDGGKARTDIKSYKLGQIDQRYSRAAMGQIEKNHYIFMTIGWEYDFSTSTLQGAIDAMALKGCEKAYTLDGGGTGELVIGERRFSRPDYDIERPVSDIIYFVSYAK